MRPVTLASISAILSVSAALLLAGCPAGTQAPPAFRWTPEVKPGAYFPLETGTAWSYTALDPSTGRNVLVINRVQSREGNRAILAVDPDPLAYEDLGDSIVSFPSRKPVLKAPIAKGTSWPLAIGTATITAIDAAIDTPAGRYLSCVVVEEIASDRRIVTSFAPGVGPVQIEIYAREAGAELLVSSAKLRSYHAAGAESP